VGNDEEKEGHRAASKEGGVAVRKDQQGVWGGLSKNVKTALAPRSPKKNRPKKSPASEKKRLTPLFCKKIQLRRVRSPAKSQGREGAEPETEALGMHASGPSQAETATCLTIGLIKTTTESLKSRARRHREGGHAKSHRPALPHLKRELTESLRNGTQKPQIRSIRGTGHQPQ